MTEEDFPSYRLLQPELMTSDELVNILLKYNVKVDFKNADIGELVEIYKRVALPLPQRTYGKSWRERLLAKKQNRRRISITEESEKPSSTLKRETPSSSAGSASSRPTHDRLKPPLDSSTKKGKKTIKLSSSKSDNSKVRTSSSESIDSTKDTNDKTEPNSKRKRITIDFSDTTEKSTPLPKVISSKRPSDEKSQRQTSSKHRRIVI